MSDDAAIEREIRELEREILMRLAEHCGSVAWVSTVDWPTVSITTGNHE